jgi:hypothetical protein
MSNFQRNDKAYHFANDDQTKSAVLWFGLFVAVVLGLYWIF